MVERLFTGIHPRFIASVSAFFAQPRADNPNQRMNPETRLHQHMDHRQQIVLPPQMGEFVSQDGVDLRSRSRSVRLSGTRITGRRMPTRPGSSNSVVALTGIWLSRASALASRTIADNC